jgi:hypothetical protein
MECTGDPVMQITSMAVRGAAAAAEERANIAF